MKPIKTCTVYGLGALGMLFGSMLQNKYGPDNVKFVMDSPRYARHKIDLYTINGEPFDFALLDGSDVAVPSDTVVFGEAGLSGEVRSVAMAEQRVKEAAKLGFARVILPAACRRSLPAQTDGQGPELLFVSTVRQAVALLDRLGRS